MRKTVLTEEHLRLVAAIKRERERRGISQNELARRLQVSQPWVVRLEVGGRRLDVVELHALAKVIGFDAYALQREVWPNHKRR
jgi:transcriptional regulator with XRE-family HTH domain